MIIERGMERGMERGFEQGKQAGAKESAIQSIMDVLDQRFEVSTAPFLTHLLEPIDDIQQLRQLLRDALNVEHLEDFIRPIQNTQNGA